MTDLDEALERFQLGALEYAGGLANHGPMVAEALGHLGHPALIPGLIDIYAPRLPAIGIGAVLEEAERIPALGDAARLPDWVATFDHALRERPWRDVLSTWAPVLLPGLFAGATHGWLRVAHAVRALSEAETLPRVRELGMGLAYWAGRYQMLPGSPGRQPVAGHGVGATFEAAKVVPPASRRPGFFFDSVKVLDDDADFAANVDAFEPGDTDVDGLLHEITLAGARQYLAWPSARIAYVHCVTAPSAIRLVAACLPEEVARTAVGYALQAALALHAVSAGTGPAAEPDDAAHKLAENEAELRYRAACSLEEHAIKFTEACLREDALHPDPVFRLAAADAALRLDTGDGRGAVA